MNIQICTKESFAVVGKEGSTKDGKDFIQNLWQDANSHFNEVESIVKKDETGTLLGIWGAMSDYSHQFAPWEDDFSQGLYLAGVECVNEAVPPKGWIKWTIPGYEYLYVEKEKETTFFEVISYMKEKKIDLAGASHEFICPETGKEYLFFPTKKLV